MDKKLLLAAALGMAMHPQQSLRHAFRGIGTIPNGARQNRYNRYTPHQGEREKARRRWQAKRAASPWLPYRERDFQADAFAVS